MSSDPRNISTPQRKNERFGKRPSIRRSRSRSPRVIRRLRIRIQMTMRHSSVNIPQRRGRRTRLRPDHTREGLFFFLKFLLLDKGHFILSD